MRIIALLLLLTACAPDPGAVEPTDGGCGPGAWKTETRADGSINPCVPDGW